MGEVESSAPSKHFACQSDLFKQTLGLRSIGHGLVELRYRYRIDRPRFSSRALKAAIRVGDRKRRLLCAAMSLLGVTWLEVCIHRQAVRLDYDQFCCIFPAVLFKRGSRSLVGWVDVIWLVPCAERPRSANSFTR